MSSESYFKVPKEQDFLKIIEDAEEAGVLDKAATAVNNPLSWLRFIPGLGVGIRQAELEAEKQGSDKQNPLFEKGFKETDEEKDLAKELDRAIIGGGVKNNVIPTVAKATINFRILPGETIESVQKHVQSIISNKIKVAPVGFLTNPSPVSEINSEAYKVLEKTIRSMFPNSIVVPGLVGGGTDARYFYDISDDVYRFYPIRLSPETRTRFHGIDEKISKENYKEIIEFSYHLIKGLN